MSATDTDFGKQGRRKIASGVFKLSGKAVATANFDNGAENIYVIAKVHVKKSGGIAFSDLPKEGLVKEIRFETDQLVVCPDELVDDVAGYLSAIEDAEALEAAEANLDE